MYGRILLRRSFDALLCAIYSIYIAPIYDASRGLLDVSIILYDYTLYIASYIMTTRFMTTRFRQGYFQLPCFKALSNCNRTGLLHYPYNVHSPQTPLSRKGRAVVECVYRIRPATGTNAGAAAGNAPNAWDT